MNTFTSSSAHTNTNTNKNPSVLAGFEAAYAKTAAARANVRFEDVLQINLDIPNSVATVVGALPRAFTLRDQFVKLFTPAELAELDAIPTYADALSFAHTAVLAASQPMPPLHNLFARATELRDLLMSDATALANRGIIDPKVIADLKGGTGYLAVAYDLGAIVHLLRERWSEVSKRSAISELDVKEAESLYEQVTRAFAERERQSDAVVAATADRARAYTLFVNAYDQLRRAAMFVRWQQGDADKFVPSLYAGRGGRGNVVKPPVQTTTATDAVAKAGSGTAPAVTAPPVEAPSEPGMPGGSPFSS